MTNTVREQFREIVPRQLFLGGNICADLQASLPSTASTLFPLLAPYFPLP